MKQTLYSIKDLEVLSGIKAHTIRIWEKRYNLLNPQRTDTNIRYYDDDDLRYILNISFLVRNGFRISKISSWDSEKIREEIIAIQDQTTSESEILEKLIFHVVNFNDHGFNKLVNDIFRDYGVEHAISKIIFPFFQKIGFYWQVGSIFPAQEHFVSNLIRQKLISQIEQLYANPSREETVMFYLREGEQHELSLLFYSLLALNRGYNIFYLGQSVPVIDLEKIVEKRKVDHVFTAFVNSIEKEELQSYLDHISHIFGNRRVFVTGRQLEIHKPKLPRKFKIVANPKEFDKYFGPVLI